MTDTTQLLRLLEQTYPGRSRDELLKLIDETPDAKPTRAPEKPTQRRVGSRPRTDASMERRRSWAASGRMPPKLAARFTLAEQAVLAVIAVEVVKHGACELTIGNIAALAGVCNQTVRNAMREAASLGCIHVEERRVSAWRNAPNRVTITDPAWSAWLRLGRRGEGQNPSTPRVQDSRKQSESHSTPNAQKGLRMAEGRERWR